MINHQRLSCLTILYFATLVTQIFLFTIKLSSLTVIVSMHMRWQYFTDQVMYVFYLHRQQIFFSNSFVEFKAHIHDSNSMCLVLMNVEILSTTDKIGTKRRVFRCTDALTGSILLSSAVIPWPLKIVRKVAYHRCSNNTASTSNAFVFFQYPNIQGATWCTRLLNWIDHLLGTNIHFDVS